jgi:hypothetical protein
MSSEVIRRGQVRATFRHAPSWIVIALVTLSIVVLAIINIALSYPVIERFRSLSRYLSRADNREPQFSAGTLDGEIRGTLDKVLPPSWAGRVLYQRVERWAPIPLDDAATRAEALRTVADASPFPSFSYLASGNSVLAGYRDLLSHLRRDASIRAGSTDPLSLSAPNGLLHSSVFSSDAKAATSFEKASQFERTERQLFALGQGSLSVAEVDAVRHGIEPYDIPNPDTQFSPHPPVTFEQCDIERWLEAARPSTARRRISSVEMRVLPGEISASTSTTAPSDAALVEPLNNFPLLSGTFQTTVIASDWKVCVITRQWLQEPILESFRGNINPFIGTRGLFGAGGALAAIPYALVIAKDIAVEVAFSDPGVFESVRDAVAQGQTVHIQTNSSPLIVDGAFAAFDQARHSIIIPATGGTAQVIFVISKLY